MLKALLLTDRGAQYPTAVELEQIAILLNGSHDDLVDGMRSNGHTLDHVQTTGLQLNITDKNYYNKLNAKFNNKKFQIKLQQKT